MSKRRRRAASLRRDQAHPLNTLKVVPLTALREKRLAEAVQPHPTVLTWPSLRRGPDGRFP